MKFVHFKTHKVWIWYKSFERSAYMHFANQTRILWHEISIKIALKISINCNNCIRAEFRCHYLSIHLRKIPEEGKFTSFSTYLSIRLTLCCHIFNNDDNDNICTRAISLVCVCVVWRRRKSYYFHRQLKFEAIESEAPYMIYVNLIKSYCFPLLMSVDILPLPNPPHDSPKKCSFV